MGRSPRPRPGPPRRPPRPRRRARPLPPRTSRSLRQRALRWREASRLWGRRIPPPRRRCTPPGSSSGSCTKAWPRAGSACPPARSAPPGRAAGRTGDATRRSERAAPARGDAWRRRGRRRDVQQERQEVRARREKIVRLLPIPRACTPGPSRGAPPPSSTGLAMPHGDRVKKQKTTSRVHLPGFFRVFFAAISFGSF